MWFPQLATPPLLWAWLPVGPAWERAWPLRGRSNSHKPGSESPDVMGGGARVALWTTAQIAQLNNQQRDASRLPHILWPWLMGWSHFSYNWSLCRDLRNPPLSLSGHLSSWSGKTLCVVKRQSGSASFGWPASLHRTIAPRCYVLSVETADTEVRGILWMCGTQR